MRPVVCVPWPGIYRPPEGEREKTLHPGVASPSGIGCMCSIRTRQDVPRFHQPWFDFKQVCPHLHSLCCPLETFRDTEAHFIVICLREPSQGSNFRIPAHAWQLFEFKQVVSSLSTLFSSSFFFFQLKEYIVLRPLCQCWVRFEWDDAYTVCFSTWIHVQSRN